MTERRFINTGTSTVMALNTLTGQDAMVAPNRLMGNPHYKRFTFVVKGDGWEHAVKVGQLREVGVEPRTNPPTVAVIPTINPPPTTPYKRVSPPVKLAPLASAQDPTKEETRIIKRKDVPVKPAKEPAPNPKHRPQDVATKRIPKPSKKR